MAGELRLKQGSDLLNLNDYSAYSITEWPLGVAGFRENDMVGGRSPYGEISMTVTVAVLGSDASSVQGNADTLAEWLSRINRYRQYETGDPVLVEARLPGSTDGNLWQCMAVRVGGRNGVMNARNFRRQVQGGQAAEISFTLQRRGAWLVEETELSVNKNNIFGTDELARTLKGITFADVQSHQCPVRLEFRTNQSFQVGSRDQSVGAVVVLVKEAADVHVQYTPESGSTATEHSDSAITGRNFWKITNSQNYICDTSGLHNKRVQIFAGLYNTGVYAEAMAMVVTAENGATVTTLTKAPEGEAADINAFRVHRWAL